MAPLFPVFLDDTRGRRWVESTERGEHRGVSLDARLYSSRSHSRESPDRTDQVSVEPVLGKPDPSSDPVTRS